jgi:hypothetical protein
MTTFSIVNELSLSDKRILVAELKSAIKEQVYANKINRLSMKQAKEIEKKQKIQNAIKAAELKLAKLTARLSA